MRQGELGIDPHGVLVHLHAVGDGVGEIDPVRDIELVNLELVLADLARAHALAVVDCVAGLALAYQALGRPAAADEVIADPEVDAVEQTALSCLEQRLGRPASDKEVCDEMEITLEEFYELVDQIKGLNLGSFQELSGRDWQELCKEAAGKLDRFPSIHQLKELAEAMGLLRDRKGTIQAAFPWIITVCSCGNAWAVSRKAPDRQQCRCTECERSYVVAEIKKTEGQDRVARFDDSPGGGEPGGDPEAPGGTNHCAQVRA